MSLTSQAKLEMAMVENNSKQALAAEVTAMVRFAASIQVIAGVPTMQLEFDNRLLANRFADAISTLFKREAYPVTRGVSQKRSAKSVVLRINDRVAELLRRIGMITPSGYMVRGLPPHIVSGTDEDAEAVWRGAFLMQGSIGDPSRSAIIEVACPCPEVAMAMVGFARRLNVTAKSKKSRGQDKVYIRGADNIGTLLNRLGAYSTRVSWEKEFSSREESSTVNRLPNFDDANLRRSARAAVAAALRVERALEILGDDVPEHLAQAGHLRTEHRQASLEELGRLADPQLTKDAVAGRIRRLLSMADKRAEELGIDDTNAAVDEAYVEKALEALDFPSEEL
ncbi:MAG: DNA-binding protein WhiA [Corynebacterium sp.]|nr:DNA-binding protein WhiA [Corynebacterium sp.]